MKPCQQVFALVLEKLPEHKDRIEKYDQKLASVKDKYGEDEEKCDKKEEELRCKEIKEIIFDTFIPKKTRAKKVETDVPAFYL